jgi:hypothetical protein
VVQAGGQGIESTQHLDVSEPFHLNNPHGKLLRTMNRGHNARRSLPNRTPALVTPIQDSYGSFQLFKQRIRIPG